MAKTYTSTIQLHCLKEHTCASCGNVYQYEFNRKVRGSSGRSAVKATEKARANVVKTMARDTDPEPCPACGLLQPDMVGQKRVRSHKWTLGVLLIVLVTFLCLRGSNVLVAGTATWALTLTAAVAAMGFAATEGADPNRDLDANRQRAAARVAEGRVRTDPQRQPVVRTLMQADVPGRAKPRWLPVLLVALAPLLAASPELVRLARSWPANAECYPPVVGPGDTTRVYMPERIGSVKGYYRGTVEAMFDAPPTPAVPVPATTNQNDWGSTINDVKEDEKSSYHQPWVDLTIPATPSLAGKTGNCAVHLAVEYPAIAPGGTTFHTEQMEMNAGFPIRLAPANAGSQYDSLWWIASAGALGLLTLGGALLIWLANRLRTPGTMSASYPLA